MKEKDEQFEKLSSNLPPGHDKVHEENKKLRDQLEEKHKK